MRSSAVASADNAHWNKDIKKLLPDSRRGVATTQTQNKTRQNYYASLLYAISCISSSFHIFSYLQRVSENALTRTPEDVHCSLNIFAIIEIKFPKIHSFNRSVYQIIFVDRYLFASSHWYGATPVSCHHAIPIPSIGQVFLPLLLWHLA